MNEDFESLLQTFNKTIKCAPSYICSCCGSLFYEYSTHKTLKENLEKCGRSTEFINAVLYVQQTIHRLCTICKNTVKNNKIPKLGLCNGFDFHPIPHELKVFI